MYKSFHVENFRSFSQLEIRGLRTLNLVTGLNNVGKTVLLEALLLHAGGPDLRLVQMLNLPRAPRARFRQYPYGSRYPHVSNGDLEVLFHNFDTKRDVVLRGAGTPAPFGKELRLRLRPVPPERLDDEVEQERLFREEAGVEAGRRRPMSLEMLDERERTIATLDYRGLRTRGDVAFPDQLPAIYLPARERVDPIEDAERFGTLDVEGRVELLQEAVKIIEPRLRRISVVVTNELPSLHADIGLGRTVPVALLGDGMGRLVSIILAISNAHGGIALIDEIENGLHHTVMQKVIAVMARAAELMDTQVVASTHSLECVRAAHRAFRASSELDPRALSVHRLERDSEEDATTAHTYDIDTLAAAVDSDLEVR